MMKLYVLALTITIVMGIGCASIYPFGSKVMSNDIDFSSPLRIPVAPNPGSFSIGYWETGVVIGFDNTDVVYLHQGALTLTPGVFANDVRLTPFGSLPAGSKVTPQDNDINKPLSPIPSTFPGVPTIGWVNLYGSPNYDIPDPVYIHQGGTALQFTGTGDVRLTFAEGMLPGTKLSDSDPDLSRWFQLPGSGLPPNPLGTVTGAPVVPPALIQYVDKNGNGAYDYPDDVYLDYNIGAAPNVVEVNDVRLSGPI